MRDLSLNSRFPAPTILMNDQEHLVHARSPAAQGLLNLTITAALVVFAFAARLALWPYASMESNDHTYRVFTAWIWADNPELAFYGLWGPLHYFLVGPIIRLFGDQVVAPVLLHVVVGSLIPAVLYLFTAREFGDRRAALAVGAAFALYPIAIRMSLQVMAQTWFYLCVALALLALSCARTPPANRRAATALGCAAAAGLAATLGSLLRAEGWFMIPLLALTLWPRRMHIAVFLAIASIGPVLMMVANAEQYGDPLFPLNQSAALMMNDVGAAEFTTGDRVGQVMKLAAGLVGGLTPVLALFAGLGALGCLIRRAPQAVWLLPLAGLGLSLFLGTARGSVTPKPIFTGTLGLLLIPFLAAFLTSPDVRRLGTAGTVGLVTILFGSMALSLALGVARDIPGVQERYPLIALMPAVGPVPTFRGAETLDRIVPDVQPERGSDGGALIVDAIGNPASYFLALHSGRSPDRIVLAPGQTFRSPEGEMAEAAPASDDGAASWEPWDPHPPNLRGFLLRQCAGVLVLQPGSRFSDWLGYDRTSRISFRGVELVLDKQASVPWPLPGDARLRGAHVPATARGEIVVLRYAVENCARLAVHDRARTKPTGQSRDRHPGTQEVGSPT